MLCLVHAIDEWRLCVSEKKGLCGAIFFLFRFVFIIARYLSSSQVYTAEEQRMLAQLNVEEARKKEAKMMAQFRQMIETKTKKNTTK